MPHALRIAPRLILGGCLILSLAACGSSGPSDEDIERQTEIHLDSSRAYINMGEYQRAEDQARRGLSMAPDDVDLKLVLARAMQMQGTTAKILHAESIYRTLPRDEDFRVSLGFAESLERKGLAFAEAADGVRSLERPVDASQDPEVVADEHMATAMSAWAESAQVFAEGLELNVGNTELMNGLARVYSLMGDLEQGLEWCNATLGIIVNDRQFWDGQLARTDLSVNEEQRYRSALARLNELEIGLRLLAANIDVGLDNKEGAIEHLGKVIELDPMLAQAYSLRAGLLMDLERYEEVIADIDTFLGHTDLPFESLKIKRAFDLRLAAEQSLAAQDV